MATTNINIRVDSELKRQAESLFSDLGLSMSSAITMFLKVAVMRNGIPFDVKRCAPNASTIAAMHEAKQISRDSAKQGYTDMGELKKALLED